MTAALFACHAVALVLMPGVMVGVINRVKSRWAGRQGPRLGQAWSDWSRLLRKTPVYSEASTWHFPAAPWLGLATTFVAGLLAPLAPGYAAAGFSGDVVLFAYLLALGRMATMLAALDTASAFEGMGASREAAYSALLEPAALMSVGALACGANALSFHELVAARQAGWLGAGVLAAVGFAWAVSLLVEASRVPADDPTTHLELTMVHEVMVLDNSGPELAAVQYGAGMKLTVFGLALASLANPFSAAAGPWQALAAVATQLALLVGIAAAVGLLESLIARLRFRTLPLLLLAAFLAPTLALVAVVARQGGLR